jgi:outer membrane immunogenic protein
MKRLFGASLAFIGLSIGAASAADMPVKAGALPVAVSNWTGFYIGGNGGGDWSNDSYRYNFSSPLGAGTPEVFNFNTSSWIAGLQAGYQYQSGNWVVGVEGTWSWTNLHQTDPSALFASINGPSQRSLKINDIATVTGRIGYAWGNVLWYGKVGYAGANMQGSSDDLVGITSRASTWQNGITAGTGIDYRLSSNIILGVEFDYYHFGSTDMSTGTTPPGFTVTYTSQQANIAAVVGRVSYLFNAGY